MGLKDDLIADGSLTEDQVKATLRVIAASMTLVKSYRLLEATEPGEHVPHGTIQKIECLRDALSVLHDSSAKALVVHEIEKPEVRVKSEFGQLYQVHHESIMMQLLKGKK